MSAQTYRSASTLLEAAPLYASVEDTLRAMHALRCVRIGAAVAIAIGEREVLTFHNKAQAKSA